MSPPILLDTCAAMYLIAQEPMAHTALQAMKDAANSGVALRVSPISAWEVGMLASKGRFRSSLTPQRWFDRLRTTAGIALCDLTAEVLLASSFLPGNIHRDPMDRIIAATAREYGFTVMTRDAALLDYGRQGHLSVLPC